MAAYATLFLAFLSLIIQNSVQSQQQDVRNKQQIAQAAKDHYNDSVAKHSLDTTLEAEQVAQKAINLLIANIDHVQVNANHQLVELARMGLKEKEMLYNESQTIKQVGRVTFLLSRHVAISATIEYPTPSFNNDDWIKRVYPFLGKSPQDINPSVSFESSIQPHADDKTELMDYYLLHKTSITIIINKKIDVNTNLSSGDLIYHTIETHGNVNFYKSNTNVITEDFTADTEIINGQGKETGQKILSYGDLYNAFILVSCQFIIVG